MRSILVCFIIGVSAIASADQSKALAIPYSVKEVGAVGPNLVRLFGPGRMEIQGKVVGYDHYFAINVSMIKTLSAVINAHDACKLGISSPGTVENISVTNQSCDEVVNQISIAVELANQTGE